MDLKTGNLLWPALYGDAPEYAPLDRDIHCAAAVVGAGISGAMVAAALAEQGVEVVVLDCRQPAQGSTSASTALVLYEIDIPLIRLAKKVGAEHARRAYSACVRALDDLKSLVDRHRIDCDLIDRGSLFLAREPADLRWFEEEIAARRSCGIDVDLIDSKQLLDRFNLRRPGAIHSAAAMEVDPYRLTLGLLDRAVERGARIFGQTEVECNAPSGAGYCLRSSHGPRVECQQLIIATGYETPELFARVRELCSLRSTYALASAPLRSAEPWPEATLLWEAGDPYLYARLANARVLLGGEDEPIVNPQRRDALIEVKVERLLEKFAELCPDANLDPEFTWAGTFAQTDDGLPFIGSTSAFPNCHFALGYGGNGITFSLLASQIIRDAILGRANGDAELFRFGR